MASTSYSTIMASDVADVSSYDVFLSFRGEDTRDSFTDHLYNALNRAGIGCFRDNEEINRGEELKPEIERAIKQSRASIVVLSQNYATSTWCLDELLMILEQRRECSHFVLPVFYHVDPSDVRKQNRSFKIEVKDSSRWTDHNVNMWKKALMEVADLAGMVLSGSETEFLKKIVDNIYSKLDRKEVCLPINLTGMAMRYKEIDSMLDGSNFQFLAICGMGGCGKTTLARYIVYSNCQNFESISILEDIGSRCKEPHDLLQLQEKLFGDISGGKRRKIPSVCQGTFKIEEVLRVKKALIVLDDVVAPSQLVALLGSGFINKQSKIIITTREKNIGKWFESRSWRCQEYQMKLLDDDESLELLSRHAFGSKTLIEGYEELAKQVLQYCEGNPLALEVLGSSLSEDNSILYWESTLSLLGREIDSGIQRVLIRSYNSLPHDCNKELFLHIACFFVGKDIDYVVKVLENDYSALSGIKTLTRRCLLSISANKKLMMHPLLQEMGRTIVHQESPKDPSNRSRVWRNKDSYDVLRKGKGSNIMEGLALDMRLLKENKYALKSLNLKTDALEKMDRLKLLQLNFVQLSGSYQNFSEDLRWLCWLGFHLKTIPSDLFMGNLVALDMSYSTLEVFEPHMVLQSLKILNLKDSYNLFEIRNMYMIPHLETLILWNCHSLVRVCKTMADLRSLVLLNMTGCKSFWARINLLIRVKAFGGRVAEQPTLSFLPHSIQRLFLKDCNLDCNDAFPLTFSVQPSIQYLNLGNGLFEFLPCYDHLKNLRVLDLSLCSRLKQLVFLPSTLAELYVYYCTLLERITFESPRFTLQEFGYEGCISLCEIEGFIKLVPVAKIEENDLGHMKWLKEYQNHEVCLVGDDELTIGRSWCVEMLYEFGIMSTSLPNINDPNIKPTYVSELSSLSFDVPLCPNKRRLIGLDVTFKYTISSDIDWAWFCKVSTSSGVDLMYNPKVFGKPEVDKVGIWLSYWPIGSTLQTGVKVNVSIAVLSGLKVHACGVSLVYADDEVASETLESNMDWVEVLGRDFSRFQLSTGAYYLCRRDFFELMEVGRLIPGWLRILVGDAIDYAEVRGWRKTGRPKQFNPSFTELKFVRCIIHGPELEDIYKITEMSKLSLVDITSNGLGETMKSATSSKSLDTPKREAIYNIVEMSKSSSEDKNIGRFGETTTGATSSKFGDTTIKIAEEKPSNFIPILRSGEWSDSGSRPYMEDTHICIQDLAKKFSNKILGEESVSFYGVFDGHGGKEASDFVRDNLPRIIVADADFPLELEKVVTRSFMETDAAFARSYALESTLSSGTTALAALIFGRSLLVANAGNSRAVLSRNGRALDISNDHTPIYNKERIRVESLGGFVEDGYLNGQLAVTRAIGNWDMKGLKEMGDHISPLTAEPELKLITLTKEDEFLILGSDGIWDAISSQNAVNFVMRQLQEHNDINRCCMELAKEALRRGSFDNLTVVIVCFQPEPPPQVVAQRRARVSRTISAEELLKLKSFLEE